MKRILFSLLALVCMTLTASAEDPAFKIKVGTNDHGTFSFLVNGNAKALQNDEIAVDENDDITLTVTPDAHWMVNQASGVWTAAVAKAPGRNLIDMKKDIDLGSGSTDPTSGAVTYTFKMIAANAEISCTYKKLLTNSDITVEDIADQTYTGSDIEPTITVKDGGTAITLNTDYTVSYSNNTNVAAANDANPPTVTITGTGDNYAGTISVTFNIVKADVTLTPPTAAENLVYSGQAQALLNSDGAVDGVGDMTDVKILYSLDQETWAEDISTGIVATDYTVYYKVDGGANHNGVEAASINNTIAPAALTALTLTQTNFVYNQQEQTAEVASVSAGDLTVPEEGYDVSDNSATTVGTYTAKVTGKGNFTGEAEAQFSIVAAGAQTFAITFNPTSFTYNGEEQKPAVTVKDGETTLTLDTDYTLAFTDAVNAGTVTITATGKGNYTGTNTATYTIAPAELTTLTLAQTNFVYNQQEQTAEVSDVKAGELTVPAEGYDLTGNTATTVGTYTAKVTGKGNFTGEATAQFSIVAADAQTFAITLEPSSFTYNAQEQKPAVTVKDGETTLTLDTDYTLAFTDAVNAGTVTVTATGIGNYSGTATATYTIAPAELTTLTLAQTNLTYNQEEQTVEVSEVKAGELTVPAEGYDLTGNTATTVGTYTAKVTGKGNFTGEAEAQFSIVAAGAQTFAITFNPTSFTYNGEEQKPAVTVKDGETTLTLDTDYTLAFTDAVNAGTVTVTATGTGNYSGTATATYTIAPAELTTLTLAQTNLTYNQEEQTVEVSEVKAGELTVPAEGYDLTGNTATTVGTYTAKVTGKGNFTGEAEAQFSIVAAGAQTFAITLDPTLFTYNGEEQKPAVTVKDGETTLTLDTDYTLAFTDATNAGTVTVTATGTGNYSGTATATYTIAPAELTALTLKQDKFTYTGEEQTVEVSEVKAGDLTVPVEGYDISGNKGTNVGNYTVKVTGKGNFTGEAEAQFSIVAAGAQTFAITLDPTLFTYNGQEQKPAVTVKDGEATLALDTDYTLAFTDAVNAGTVTVTATGTGNYSGTATATYTIAPAELTALTLKQDKFTYTGEEQTVEVESVLAGGLSVPVEGYDISGNKATNVGEYTAKVTGKGNFTGEATAVYTIVKDDTPETLNIDIEVSDAETGEESKVNAKMNVTVDPKGEVTQREIIVIDEATGEKVKKTVTVVPVILENIDLTGQEGGSDGNKTDLSVTIPKSVLSPDGTVLYEVTGIKKDAFKSDNPSVIVTTVILEDNDRLLDIEEGAMNTDDGSVMKIIAPLRLLDDYALMPTLKDNYEAERISAIITPPNRYWTFSCGVDVLVPEGVSVYTCHVVSDKAVEINELTAAQLMYNGEPTIKHNNGVLIACTDGTDSNAYEIVAKPGDQKSGTKPATGNAKNYPGNQLEPVIENTHFDYNDCYVLKNNEFHAILNNDSEVSACKAVLRKPATAAARLRIMVAEEATGIRSMDNGQLIMDNWYDLQGRKVVVKTKGIRIINGKKVIIK